MQIAKANSVTITTITALRRAWARSNPKPNVPGKMPQAIEEVIAQGQQRDGDEALERSRGQRGHGLGVREWPRATAISQTIMTISAPNRAIPLIRCSIDSVIV